MAGVTPVTVIEPRMRILVHSRVDLTLLDSGMMLLLPKHRDGSLLHHQCPVSLNIRTNHSVWPGQPWFPVTSSMRTDGSDQGNAGVTHSPALSIVLQ